MSARTMKASPSTRRCSWLRRFSRTADCMHDKQSYLGAAVDMNPACSAAAALVVGKADERLTSSANSCLHARSQLKGEQSMQANRWELW